MKIYRNSYGTTSWGSSGFEFFASKKDAKRAYAEAIKNETTEPGDAQSVCAEVIETGNTKREIIALLSQYAEHADNG